LRVACSSEFRIFPCRAAREQADQERAGGADAACFGGRKARQERQAIEPPITK